LTFSILTNDFYKKDEVTKKQSKYHFYLQQKYSFSWKQLATGLK